MEDVLPFLALAVIAVAAWVIYLIARGPSRPALPPADSSFAMLDHPRVREWYRLLQDYDELAMQQLNDLDIKPLLPAEMQQNMRDLHDRFKRSV